MRNVTRFRTKICRKCKTESEQGDDYRAGTSKAYAKRGDYKNSKDDS